jgi:hypothetical protein
MRCGNSSAPGTAPPLPRRWEVKTSAAWARRKWPWSMPIAIGISTPNGVIWLSADWDLDAQLAEVAVKARWIAPESERRTIVEMARHRLRSVADCLIVFDNVQDAASIRDYLPEPPAAPHILITSRTEQPDAAAVCIDRLDPADASRLLIQTAGREPDGAAECDAASTLAQTLDGLPLALELAGGLLACGAMRFHDALQQIQPDGGLISPDRHAAVLESILRSDAEAAAGQPLLAAILDVLAWSGQAPMGRALLAALVGTADGTELTAALELGTTLRIIRPVPETTRYALHQQVGAVLRAQAPIADRPDWAAQQCTRVIAWFSALLGDPQQVSRFEAELDHLREWHDHAVRCAPMLAARLTSLAIRRGLHGDRHRDTAASLNNIATFTFALGNQQHALDMAGQALGIHRDLYGDRHPETAASLTSVAYYTHALGDTPRAMELAKQALTIRRDLFGDRHPDTAMSLNTLATYADALGEQQRALDLAQQGLAIQHELFGLRHPATAKCLHNTAGYLLKLGKTNEAYTQAQAAYDIFRQLLGVKHPQTLSTAMLLSRP